MSRLRVMPALEATQNGSVCAHLPAAMLLSPPRNNRQGGNSRSGSDVAMRHPLLIAAYWIAFCGHASFQSAVAALNLTIRSAGCGCAQEGAGQL